MTVSHAKMAQKDLKVFNYRVDLFILLFIILLLVIFKYIRKTLIYLI